MVEEMKATLQREQKKNKKLEERFTQIVKEKNQLQKKLDSVQQLCTANESTIEALEMEASQIESVLTMSFGIGDLRTQQGKFDIDKISQLLLKNANAKALKIHKQSEDEELVAVLKEESDNMKLKLIQLTERNNQIQREQTKINQAHQIEVQDLKRQLNEYQEREFELNEIKGHQLLKNLFTNGQQVSETPAVVKLKSDVRESEIVKDLQERLRFANETVSTLIEQTSKVEDDSNISLGMSNTEDDSKLLAELEQQKNDLVAEMDQMRMKAHQMLRQRDTEERRLKLAVNKLQQFLKTKHNMTEQQIQDVCSVAESEFNTDSEEEESKQTCQQTQVQAVVMKEQPLEYVRNMFLKYLELRYSSKRDKVQVATIEQVLMSELAFTFEQQQKVDKLIQKKKKQSGWNMLTKVIR